LVLGSGLKARARAKYLHDDRGDDGDRPSQDERATSAVDRIRSLIAEAAVAAALAAYDKAARTLFQWPSQPDLYELIKALHAGGAESDSIRLMRDHCRYYPERSLKMRVKLAQILIRDCQRPVAALRVLEEIPPGSLPADLEAARQKLAAKAQQMLEEGVVEMEGDD